MTFLALCTRTLPGLTLAVLLAACSEKAQTSGTNKTDVDVSQGVANAYVASGWKLGDKASWEGQMRTRVQSQDEYPRVKQ